VKIFSQASRSGLKVLLHLSKGNRLVASVKAFFQLCFFEACRGLCWVTSLKADFAATSFKFKF
jgi:hypothetical protein